MSAAFRLRATGGGATLQGGAVLRGAGVFLVAVGQAQETDSAQDIATITPQSRALKISVVKGHVLGQAIEVNVSQRMANHTPPPAVRQLGTPTVAIAWVARPDGQAHNRGVSVLTIRGRMTVQADGQAHIRGQGIPQLSARVAPVGLSRSRQLGALEVNLRVLVTPGLTRV